MIGSFLTRGLVMAFGYAYPAYECYKTVEKNKPDIEELRFWCQYWILVAVLTVSERIGDTFVSWVPMYSEAKLAFFIYLWFPKTKGTTYVYDSFFRPYVAKHETEIDRNLLELRTRAGDIAVLYWQRAASYGQTRIFEILQYIAAQSTPRPRPAQTQQQGSRVRQPTAAPNRKPATGAATEPEAEQPPSPTSSSSSSQQEEEDATQESGPSQAAIATAPSAAVVNAQKASATKTLAETSNLSSSNDTEAMLVEPSSSSNASVEETIIKEAVLVTRGRLRKNRSASNQIVK